LVTASAGSDGAVLYGSAGNDTIDASAVLTATGVTIYGGTGASDPTDGADSITGSSGSDAIYGNGGNDTINGGAGGQDSLYGGAGNDAMTGGDTGTVIYGGAGSDAITATAASTIYGGSGVSDPTDGADVITGSGLADSIYGNGGNDSIASGGGADNIFGGAGDDTITASGAAANATLTGGDGADVFVFSETGSDTATLPTVTDFTTGTDHLDFGFAAAPTLTHATSLADFLTNAPTGTNTASWVSNGSGGVFVAAGTGALTIYAQLNNVTSISTSDFLPHAT
jgi:Ca2+-binding RTX toxin-like protein